MRVVHILGELRRSGAEMMYHSALEFWRSQGIETELLSTGAVPGEMAEELAACGARIHHLPFSRSAHHIIEVASFLRRQRFDVVHLDTERANIWYGMAAATVPGTRIFRTVHGVFDFQGGLRVRRKVQRQLLRRLGVTSIAVSPSVQKVEAECFGNPSELVPNWIDSRRFRVPSAEEREAARELFGLPKGSFAVSTVAGCAPVKNHGAVILAMAMIGDEIPLVYLHAGREANDGAERALAEELGVAGRIRFLGIVKDVVPVLHASDVYAMPSLHEGCGVAAMEAMAAGVPTILSRVQGLRDFEDVCPGIIWTEPTAESVAGVLRSSSQMSSSARRETGEGLSRVAHRRYGLENGAQRYADLYKGCRS